MTLRWLNKFRSLYASADENNLLPEKDRFYPWSGAAHNVDREFVARCRGKVLLDLGCGPPEAREAARAVGTSQYIGLDFLIGNRPDAVVSIDQLCLRNESVDGINCISVLEHVYHPREIIAEMFRVMRPGGCVRVQVPFLLGYHDFPEDYFRYTHSALRRMFEEAGFRMLLLETDWSKGTYLNAAITLQHGSWSFIQPRWRFVTRVLASILLWLSAKIDKYYAPGHVGIYHAVIMLAEKLANQGQG